MSDYFNSFPCVVFDFPPFSTVTTSTHLTHIILNPYARYNERLGDDRYFRSSHERPLYKPPDSPVADIGDGSTKLLEPILTATNSSLHAIHRGIASDLICRSSGRPGKSNNISELESPSSIRASIYNSRKSEVKASASMLRSNGFFSLDIISN